METEILRVYREVFPERADDDYERLGILETVRKNQITLGDILISIDDAIYVTDTDLAIQSTPSSDLEVYKSVLLAVKEMRDWYQQICSTIKEGNDRLMPLLAHAELDSVVNCLTECLTVLDLCRKAEYEQIMEQAKNTPWKIRTNAVYATVEYLRKSSNPNVVEFANEELAKFEAELKENLSDALEPNKNRRISRRRTDRAVKDLMATRRPKLKEYAIDQLKCASYAYQ